MQLQFASVWRNDLLREYVLGHLPQSDIQSLRLVCHEFADQTAVHLFRNLSVTFNVNSFTRRSRVAALERIGYHVKTFRFNMPHGPETFLPVLLIPGTLEEATFVYQPQKQGSRPSSSSSESSGRYGTWELDDLLIKHYPPLFHAATNVISFTRILSALTSLKTLHISCPGQHAEQRYRKDAVDYALISLRTAVECVNPPSLETLILDPVHPAATLHLRPQFSIGASPASTRVWRRIKDLRIVMASFPHDRDCTVDHLKVLHTYLQSLTALEHFHFTWQGEKGPCPLSLHAEPCTSRPQSLDYDTSCPIASSSPSCKPIRFRHLKSMHLINACLDASQASAFIASHRKGLQEFEFAECHLRSGTWEEALAPLDRMIHGDHERPRSHEVMEVPFILKADIEKRRTECVRHALWDDINTKQRGLHTLRRLGWMTRDIIPDPIRRMFHTSRLAWH